MDGTDIKAQIADELYTALEMQPVDRKLLAIVGTWKSSRPVDLEDLEVLSQLRAYNARNNATQHHGPQTEAPNKSRAKGL